MRGRSYGWIASLVAQFFNSSVVLPKYSRTWRLISSISPAAFAVDTNPGMLSTIRRRLCSFDLRASSARFRSSRSVFVPYHLTTRPVRWTPLFGQNFRRFLDGAAGCPGGGPKAAIHAGLESALGSHPCVALSSYQAPPLYG